MMARVRRYTLPLLGAGFLVLVAVASFLILDPTGFGPESASDLPVVDIGQAEVDSTDQEATGGLPFTTAGMPAGTQSPTIGQQGGSGDRSSSEHEGGFGQPAGPGQQGGSGPSSSANTTAPGTETSTGTSLSGQPETTGESVAGQGGATGSTLRQTVSGGVRVEGGPRSGQGTGAGSTPATTGGGR